MCTKIFYCQKIFAKELKKYRDVEIEEKENCPKFKITYDPKEDFDEIYLKFKLIPSNDEETMFRDRRHIILFRPTPKGSI